MNDGGPAFPGQWYDFQPTTGEQVVRESFVGMTLRDYFAAAALQGIIAAQANPQSNEYADDACKRTFPRHAYEFADAMLKQREKGV
jgi:hypothetical protein